MMDNTDLVQCNMSYVILDKVCVKLSDDLCGQAWCAFKTLTVKEQRRVERIIKHKATLLSQDLIPVKIHVFLELFASGYYLVKGYEDVLALVEADLEWVPAVIVQKHQTIMRGQK